MFLPATAFYNAWLTVEASPHVPLNKLGGAELFSHYRLGATGGMLRQPGWPGWGSGWLAARHRPRSDLGLPTGVDLVAAES